MLTLICGIPNAGKTTLSRKFDNVVHLDGRYCNNGEYDRINRIASQTKGDICVEGIYLKRAEREALIKAYNGKSVCIWLNTPLDECLKREKEYRKRPLFLVTNSNKRLEPPSYEEGWDYIITI